MKLSVIIPCFNESKTIKTIVDLIIKTPVKEKEIIIVDDCSTDGTQDLLKKEIEPLVSKVIYHEKNMGKGMAVRSAIGHITGDIIVIQDADLELDPQDYMRLIGPIKSRKELVIYGARTGVGPFHSNLIFYVGRKILSFLTNILYNQRLTDAPTCYKVFDSRLLKSIPLRCKGFEFDPEITAKIAKRGIKIREIPIKYYPRKFREGKKIRWTDGVIAVWILIKYRFVN